MAHKKKIVFVSIIYTVVLTYFSLKSEPISIKLPSQSDKILHALAYFIFTIFWFLSFKYTFSLQKKKSFLNTFILSLVFGAFIEILQQQLTNYRQADVLDVLANTFGTILAIVMLNLMFKDR